MQLIDGKPKMEGNLDSLNIAELSTDVLGDEGDFISCILEKVLLPSKQITQT